MVSIFGIYVGRRASIEARIKDLSGDTRIGDLVPVVGGCPRYPGDRCDLVGGLTSVVVEYKGALFYKIVVP